MVIIKQVSVLQI